MRRLLAFLPILVLAALAVLFFGYGLHRKSEIVPQAMVGKPMPQMDLPRLEDNAPMALSDAVARLGADPDGKRGPVLINFYQSYCAPCIIENPELMKLRASGIKIIGVSWKDEPADTRRFLTTRGDPFTLHLVDQANRLGTEFGVTAVPETYLIDAQGVIRAKHAGVISEAEAMALLRGKPS